MQTNDLNNTYKNILKATTLFGSVEGLNIIINLIRTKLVAVLLGPTGVGLNAIYNETRELVHSSTNLGLDASGIRNISISYEQYLNSSDDAARRQALSQLNADITVVRSWVLLLAVAGTLLMMLLAQPLSYLTFQDASHTMPYVLLSPAVGFSTMACGELTILKGVRKLKSVAMISVLTVLSGMCVSIPIYFIYGISGVLPALIAVFCAAMLVAMFFSYRAYPPHFDFSKSRLSAGIPLLTVGMAFMLTNLIDHLVQLGIQAQLNDMGSLDIVGLYQSNSTITATYLGVFIAALGNDYFPRLSGVFSETQKRIALVRNHVSFLTSLVSPALVVILFALPVLVPLLFSQEFVEVIPLTQLAIPAMLLRAMHLPFTYIPLAAGHSKTYFALNTLQGVDMVLVIPGYYWGGLTGIGIMIVVINLIDIVASLLCAGLKYGVTMSHSTAFFGICQLAVLAGSYYASISLTGIAYWAAAAAMTAVSAVASFVYLKTTATAK